MQWIGEYITRRAAGLALGLSFVSAVSGIAQYRGLREVRDWGAAGGGLVVGIPVGQFGDFVDVAGGLRGFLAVNLDRRSALGLRLEGSYMLYGHERRLVPLSGTGGLLSLDLGTDFYIASLRAGPQFAWSEGRTRLYGFGTLGVSYFAAETALRGCDWGCGGFPSTINFDDAALALEGGGGVLITLTRGRHPVSLDLGASYVRNGTVRYLREGSISQNPDGSFTIRPVQSEANLVTLQLGVAIGL